MPFIFQNNSIFLWSLGPALYLLGGSTCVLACVAAAELVQPGCSPRFLSTTLSKLVHFYLVHRNPIKASDGLRPLPSCPFQWPNGQGDNAKFIHGAENSAVWQESYGSLYRIWSGTQSEIVLTEPRQLSKVFHDSDKHTKAFANNSGAYMNRLLGRCVGLISGQEWRRVRAVVDVPFSFHASSLPARMESIARLVDQHFDRLNREGSVSLGMIHPANDMKMLPFWVVCEVFYGRLPVQLSQELEAIAPLRERMFRHVLRGGLTRFEWAAWLPTTANAEMEEFQSRWKAFNDMAYAHAKERDEKVPIVRMYEAMDEGRLSKEELLQTLDEALYANLDVTTGGLSWNLVFLAANRPTQEELRREAQLARDEHREEAYLRSDATLLAACILESSRLKPLAAFSVPQATPTARQVEDYTIPAGTNFIVDSHALNIRSETWAPDNTAYRPGRFLGKKGSELRYKFWRYGFGPRQCMGKYVADLTIRSALMHLVLEYELGWADEDKEDWARNMETWITHPDFSLRCTKRAE